MKTITMIQNSDEWSKLRETKLGASDANIIMGMSKFMTPHELYLKKTGNWAKEEKESNFIQEKGHRKEIKARAKFELITDKEWPPIVCLHSEYDFLMASLDGYNEELNENWECKFVGKDDFSEVKSGQMLEKYYPQVQMQLAVTGARFCNFTCINEEDEIHNIQVAVDVDYIQNKLYPALFDFWGKVQNKEAVEISEKDVVDLSDNSDLKILLSDYQEIQEKLKTLSETEKKLKERIFKICTHPKTVCNGVKITASKGEDKEVVDYEKLVADLAIDTSAFMTVKKGTTTKRITFPKS